LALGLPVPDDYTVFAKVRRVAARSDGRHRCFTSRIFSPIISRGRIPGSDGSDTEAPHFWSAVQSENQSRVKTAADTMLRFYQQTDRSQAGSSIPRPNPSALVKTCCNHGFYFILGSF